MSLHRRNPKRDANEAVLFRAFKAAGCAVLPISAPGAPDAVIFTPAGKGLLVECKALRGTLSEPQKRFHASWRGPEIHVVRSIDDVLRLIGLQ